MTRSHVLVNRDYWNGMAENWVAAGERLWALETPEWGEWSAPEAEVSMLPSDMSGQTAIELGCGTGYVSGWMARRGAQVTGIDVSANQLATARRLASDHNTALTLIEGNAEHLPFEDASFDFAISEYGAAIWCDPEVWLPEATRVLRPGGHLRFLGNHPLTLVTAPHSGAPSDYTLHRAYRGLRKADWRDVEIDPGGIEFNRTIGDWFTLFHDVGLQVLTYKELYAPPAAQGTPFAVPADWAKCYPTEQIWFLQKPY